MACIIFCSLTASCTQYNYQHLSVTSQTARKMAYFSPCIYQLGKTRQTTYISCNVKACLCNHCCNGKAISVTHSERVSIALGIQQAMCMHLLPSVVHPPLSYFCTLSKKNGTFSEKVMNHKMYILIFSN